MRKSSANCAVVRMLVVLTCGCGETAQSTSPIGLGGSATASSGSIDSAERGGASTSLGGATSGGSSALRAQDGASIKGIGGASASTSTSRVMGGASATETGGRVLVFSRTAGYRHSSIEPGIAALERLAREHEFSLTATEDASVFSESGLADYDVVLFLSTTGDVLDTAQQLAFESFIRSGRGYVGVHAASDTEYDWPWYGGLIGTYFRDHPDVQSASILVENTSHPATAHLPATWTRRDEWYAFKENPRGRVEVLMCLDESTYEHAVGSMGADHPIAWYHEYEGGRAFYTGLGHTEESYQEPAFLEHLWGAIRWAAAW